MKLDVEAVNETTKQLIHDCAHELDDLSFEEQAVVIEGVTAALLVYAAFRFNKNPDQLAARFGKNVCDRVTWAIYGRQQ